MAGHTITIELTPEIEAQLAALAEARNQAVSDVAADAIASYVALDGGDREHIRTGRAELEAGEGIPNERVMEWLDSWGTENELRPPR